MSGCCQRRTIASNADTSPASTRATSAASSSALTQVSYRSATAPYAERLRYFRRSGQETNATGSCAGRSYRTNLKEGARMGLWLFLSFGVVSVFSCGAVAIWAGTRHEERKDFYRSEMLRKLAESGPAAVVEYLREEERQQERRRAEQRVREREGTRLGGLILLAIGITLTIA